MTEQYEDPSDGFFEAPVPVSEPPRVHEGEQYSDEVTGTPRETLAPIPGRPSEPKVSEELTRPERPEPSGAHRLRKGMALQKNVLERLLGGGKSPDVWQATHPEFGSTLLKVVQDPTYPTAEIRRTDPIGFEVREKSFLEFETFHKKVMETLTPQRTGDGALLKLLDMGRTEEGRIFKVTKFLTHEVLASSGLLGRKSKDSHDPAPAINKIKANGWSSDKKLRLVKSVLLSLWQLHRHQFVHGDIKPANILVANTPAGYVARLIDYDNCFPSGSPFDATHIGGDPPYFSPERAEYQDGELKDVSMLTTSSDLFSLALVLHEVLSEKGKRPIWSIKSGTAEESCSAGGIPEYLPLGTGNTRLEQLLQACLRLNPSDRPSTYDLLVASGVYIEREA